MLRHTRRLLYFFLVGAVCLGEPSARLWADEAPAEPNTLSVKERAAGWQLLFDGHSTAGWRGYRSQKMPESWRVEHGSLLPRREAGKPNGDIITVDQYADFELLVDWKMTPGNNSGIIYRASEELDNVWESGPEFQVLDNQGHPDGLNPLASAGGCYAVFAPARNATRPLGQWNTARIVARGKHVEHWLNGEQTVQYEVDTEHWRAHVKTSKFFPTAYGNGNWGRAAQGHIGLQDYGGEIEFRNIKLRPLTTSGDRTCRNSTTRLDDCFVIRLTERIESNELACVVACVCLCIPARTLIYGVDLLHRDSRNRHRE